MLAAAVTLVPTAEAAFPGENGKIAFVSYRYGNAEIHTVNPDGTANANVTNHPARDTEPAWSPDGKKIAFTSNRVDPDPQTCSSCNTGIFVMDADGTNVQKLTQGMPSADSAPAWSPDGTKIAFKRRQLHTMNADGTNVQQVTTNARLPEGIYSPAWSPDGNWIAFGGVVYGEDHVYWYQWMTRPDGSDLRVINYGFDANWHPNSRTIVLDEGPAGFRFDITGGNYFSYGWFHYTAAWSPDGGKIVYTRENPTGGTYRMEMMDGADGSGNVQIVPEPVGSWRDGGPDWQPIPINGYVRPKGASPVEFSLVPAYQPCTAPNRTHGPPLAFDSCAPPQRTQGQLTVGTADSNQRPTKSVSIIRMGVLAGSPSTPADEADIRLYGTVNDVRLASDLSDYTGNLEARIEVRITDKDNTPHPGGPGAATTQDLTYSFPIPCSATSDPAIGGDCTFDTTAEAFVPGIAKELRRSIWELGAMRVHDGAGNLFMTQGIFVP